MSRRKEQERERKFEELLQMDVYELLNYLVSLGDDTDFPMDVSHKTVLKHIVEKHHDDLEGLLEEHLETEGGDEDYSAMHPDETVEEFHDHED